MIRFSSTIACVVVISLIALAGEKKPVPFTSKAGKFSVKLLSTPKEETKKLKIGETEVDHHFFTVKQPDRAQVLTYIDFPKAAIGDDKDKFLAGVVERNVGALKGGKVAVNEKVTLGKGKHPGRDVCVELPEQKRLYRARVFLVGDRVYQVVVLGSDEFVKSAEVDDYLKSFAVEE